MSVSFENLTEEEISQLLLDCAKGRLSEDETRNVQTSAAATPSHAEELALYEGLAKAGENFNEGQSPDEMGWARLSRAIKTEQQNEIKSQYVGQAAQPLWRYATFALGFVVLAQAAMWFSSSNFSDEPTYVTVTETVDSYDAQVIFNPDAVEIDIRELLRSVDGEIVKGPSALGIYTCLLYTSPSPRDQRGSRMPSSA